MAGERQTLKAASQLALPVISRRRLISYRPSAANGPTSVKPEATGNINGINPPRAVTTARTKPITG